MAKERMQAIVRILTKVLLSAEDKKVNDAEVMSTAPAGPVPCTLEHSHLNAWKSSTSAQ